MDPQDTPQTEPNVEPTTTAPPNEAEVDWKVEAEKWKTHARKHETNWKRATSELDEARKASLSDADKALVEAEERGRKAAQGSIATERAQLKLEAAAAKAGVDLSVVSDLLDVSKFLTNDEVNVDAIGDFVSQLSAQFTAPKGPRFPQGLGIGPQSSAGKPGQLTRADLSRMSAAEIAEADDKGLFDDLKNGLA
ncbi:hypothetical protein ACIBG8_19575 [Nonomuraea sp. NPDC050556]|uniref:hypothetical protein n=1 Tax=Nonomuraea sp. NPDC050556 TaxID=3364369 RepID=UPI0037A356C8